MSRAVKLVIHRTQPQPRPEQVVMQPVATEPDSELYRPMTQTEAAAWLGIDPTTLSLWTRAGDVPFVKVGTKPRYTKVDLIAYTRRERVA